MVLREADFVDILVLENLFKEHGFEDFMWIGPEKINVYQWVIMKCMYGCSSYGNKAACPPNTPTIESSKKFINEYHRIAIFHFEKKSTDKEEQREWAEKTRIHFLGLEREVFLRGYYKVFALPASSCKHCDECTSKREDCKNKTISRPCAEGLGIDVYESARSVGYPIQVLKNHNELMNRYAFLFIE
jgi:predicted metal-binding protein